MKVLVVNTLYPPYVVGGAEKSVSLLCEALARTGIEVVVVSLYPGQASLVETINGVKVYRLPLDNVYWAFDQKDHSPLLKMQWHLRDIWNNCARARLSVIFDNERPDIVHTNNLIGFSVAVWAEAQSRSLSIVHTLRDYSLLCRRSSLFRNGRICERRCLDCTIMTMPAKKLFRRVDSLISNSRFLLDVHVSKGYFAKRDGNVIFNIMEAVDPIDTAKYQRNSSLTFGYIGKIGQEKGIEVVLDATTKIKHLDWRLKIAGRGPEQYVSRLKKAFPDPRIEWLGFVPVCDALRQVDVTIISSIWFEPLPRVLIESLAYRRPTICSTAGGISEIAHYADLIGEYEPTDVEALARLMERAISEGRFADTFQDNRTEDLPALFSAQTVAARTIAIYQAALAKPIQSDDRSDCASDGLGARRQNLL
jgi:glycosyltransferase involved in cell wall biosynthesis